jgi:hypothetical protein
VTEPHAPWPEVVDDARSRLRPWRRH